MPQRVKCCNSRQSSDNAVATRVSLSENFACDRIAGSWAYLDKTAIASSDRSTFTVTPVTACVQCERYHTRDKQGPDNARSPIPRVYCRGRSSLSAQVLPASEWCRACLCQPCQQYSAWTHSSMPAHSRVMMCCKPPTDLCDKVRYGAKPFRRANGEFQRIPRLKKSTMTMI